LGRQEERHCQAHYAELGGGGRGGGREKTKGQRTLYLPTSPYYHSCLEHQNAIPPLINTSMMHTKSTCQDELLSYILSQSTQQQIRCPVTPSIFLTGEKHPTNKDSNAYTGKQNLHIRTETERLIICAPSDSAQAPLPWESPSQTHCCLNY